MTAPPIAHVVFHSRLGSSLTAHAGIYSPGKFRGWRVRRYVRQGTDLVPEGGEGTQLKQFENVCVRAELNGLKRTATHGPLLLASLKSSEKRPIYEHRTITATIDVDYKMMVVDGDGLAEVWKNPVEVCFVYDDTADESGRVICFPIFRESEPIEIVTAYFHLPPNRFNWLWDKIGEFPDGQFTIDFRLTAWQSDVENHYGGDGRIPNFTIDRTADSPVHELSINVNDKPKVAAEMVINDQWKLVPTSPIANDSRVIRYLKWTVGLLGLIAVILAAKLG